MVVRGQRTSWRDEGLSLRHRLWGAPCPMADIDFLVVEHDYGYVVAIIEYKNENYIEENTSQSTWMALKNLADRSAIPLYKVVYATSYSKFEVTPMNDIGEYLKPKNSLLSEHDYVSWLYFLRGYELPSDVASKLIGD